MLKWTFITFGVIAGLLVIAVVALLVSFVGHDKDYVLSSMTSPDGHYVSELHEVITPMHGGPDTIQVKLRTVNQDFGQIIYSQVYECSPHDYPFQLNWQSATALIASYGLCDTGHSPDPNENKVLEKQSSWNRVSITYKYNGTVRTEELH